MAQNQVKEPPRLVIIGGSSGSLEALLVILPKLKRNFNIPILLVMHRSTATDSSLVELFAAHTSLQVKEADEKDSLLPGWIFIAPPDYHVLLETDGSLSLDASEKVFFCRPSIDVSFRSAAQVYTSHCVAVLLSGANSDGAAAMNAVYEAGGRNIVQDPDEAAVGYMPQQAILQSKVNYIFPAEAIAAFLNDL